MPAMLTMAASSLRRRPTRYLASFVAVLLGATVVMAFGSMMDTAGASGVPDQSKETLETTAMVVGGWGQLLVVFAVTSTLTLSVRQRAAEMALLKNVGATPRQVGSMIVGEALVVSVVAAVLALPLGLLLGDRLLAMLVDSGQVEESVSHTFGPFAIGQGVSGSVLMAAVAALLTARRATRMRAAEALADAQTEEPGMGRLRKAAAALFLLVGAVSAVMTATVMHGEKSDAMMAAGPAVIAASVGFALLAPALMRMACGVLERPLRRCGGVGGYLAAWNVRRRTRQLSTALMPVILFTGIGTGTLGMQSVENAAIADEGLLKPVDQKNLEMLNLVVIGIIVAFCCIMLVNTLVSATTFRTREFGQHRLAGATPRQVLGMVGAEGLVLSVAGVLFGAVAGLFALVPFTIARTDSALPNTGAVPAIWLGVAAVAALVTFAASWGTARRTLRRTAAVDAVLAA